LLSKKPQVHENERHDTIQYGTKSTSLDEQSNILKMLSSNILSLLAMASFALTTATAAALKPVAAAPKSNKVCSNTFYSSPQCCIPDETGLSEPDCITRELPLNPTSFLPSIFAPLFHHCPLLLLFYTLEPKLLTKCSSHSRQRRHSQ
jgi:hypothetical protein